MAEEIKKLAEKAQILDKALLERALEIYREIEDEPFSEENKAKASIYLACDESGCAAIRKLPKPKFNILSRARKKTGIKPNIEPINWVDSICELINRGKDVSEKAKEILEEYKKRSSNYYGKDPIITAAVAVYNASILCGEYINQKELEEKLKITPPPIRSRYRDMVEILSSYYSWLIRFL